MTVSSMRDFLAAVVGMGTKHNHNVDFGWPDQVTFAMLHRMYERNDLASAAVKKTTEKTFQNLPVINRGEDLDEDIAAALGRLGFWDKLADVDEYSQVGGYAGVILRLADGKKFDQPVDGVLKLDDLVEIIPAWSEQLRVSEWHTDETDAENYGKPKTFTFNESAIGVTTGANRNVVVHPDRVFIWSATGDTHARSSLLSGYNNLIDMEKVSGAGGEGFWKTAAARLNIEVEKGTDIDQFMRATEKASGKPFQEAMDDKAKKVNSGFDSTYISQGMKVAPFSISLPQPKEFFEIPLSSFAAGRSMPVKILIGMQTGERASAEDAQEWNNTITSRRNRWTLPSISDLLRKLESMGMFGAGWEIEWASLSNDTPAARIERAVKMSDVNTKHAMVADELVFSGAEIRIEAGHDAVMPQED